jgi:ATP-binding cassette subfamily F protein 3
LQKQQKRLISLEAEISKASNERTKLEQALGAPENYSDKKKFAAAESDYKKANQMLQSLNKEYESLFEKVMELETQAAG